MAYSIRQCLGCGQSFQPTSSTQKYCGKSVTRTCVICGKPYISECKKIYGKCCSKQCTNQYAHQQSVNSYRNIVKKCILCGQDFTPTNNTQVVCLNAHTRVCSICGNIFAISLPKNKNVKDIPVTCSKECANKLRFVNGNPMNNPESVAKMKATMLDRYGVDHPMHSDQIKDKLKHTMQSKYGVTSYTQTEEYREKAIQTNQRKYGTDWASQSSIVQQKVKETNMRKYGVDNPAKLPQIRDKMYNTYQSNSGYDHPLHNPEVIEKIKQTNLDKYGVKYIGSSKEIRDKAKATILDKYGVENAMQNPCIVAKAQETNLIKYGYTSAVKSPEVKSKIAATMIDRYGSTRYTASWEHRKKLVTNPEKVEDWKQFLDNPEEYINIKFDHMPTYKELESALGVDTTTIQWHLSQLHKLDIVQYTVSNYENEIVDVLHSICPKIEIKCNTRTIIAPYEIDIFLSEYNLGIEVNPTATHNSTYSPYPDNPKAPSYHKMKTDMCEEKGIFLFHIFGYEWTHRKDVVISMLQNLLNKNTNIIYARKCTLRPVPNKQAFDFLEDNHLQGGVHSRINLGLFYQDQLVSIMTFGKLRSTIGNTNLDTNECWELVRYCNLKGTSVVGGASKLFRYFCNTHNPKEIRSFSDRAHTKGNLYAILGFKEVRRSDANYVWVNITDDVAYHRMNAQKRNIRKFLQDPEIDLSLTEKQIMEAHGFAQVFDAGTITWEWTI